ncbi:MAG: N-methyl-L-tryptophan oxidase [Nocardioidaceae bacterium]|nr:MAG: N-methyl-L-tryptophan oxidase [Nocardioidaceae bacterium]
MTATSQRYDYFVVGLGALGSATAWELSRRGYRVLGLERFSLGHDRGASHDTSRILRHSYHTPAYVRLTLEAYQDWARLEQSCGQELVTKVGGLDFFPHQAAIDPSDYTAAMDEVGIDYETLDAGQVNARWPMFALADDVVSLYQPDSAIVPAGRGTAVMQELARRHGADLRDNIRVTQVRATSEGGVEVVAGGTSYAADGVVVTADAWTNDVLAGLGVHIPLEVTLEQVTYFAPSVPDRFDPAKMPLWIWMDDPSFYGFPCYGEATLKAAQDCGGPIVDPETRTFEVDQEMQDRLAAFMRTTVPGSGEVVRSLRCQYTLTRDRDFVVSAVPGNEQIVVGLGAAHGFKFAPTFGRMLADLISTGRTSSDITAFGLDRQAITDPDYQAHWLV